VASGRIARSWSPAKSVDEVFWTGLWVLGSLSLALRWSLLGSLWQEAAVRLAALCRRGRCGGPRRWSFSAGARAGPPVSRSVHHFLSHVILLL
jgi:hypothetical protein